MVKSIRKGITDIKDFKYIVFNLKANMRFLDQKRPIITFYRIMIYLGKFFWKSLFLCALYKTLESVQIAKNIIV